MILSSIICLALVLLLVLSLFWLKTTQPTVTKTCLLISVLLVLVLASALANDLSSPWKELLCVLVIIVGGLGGSVPSAYFVGLLKTTLTESNEHDQTVTGTLGFIKIKAKLPKPKKQQGADGGGRLIGIFERLALVLCLVTGQVNVLAVIVAVKGLARYPEIKSGQLTAEKFIVGTFASLLWAAGCALVAVNLA